MQIQRGRVNLILVLKQDIKRDVGREPWRQQRITGPPPGLNGWVSAFIQARVNGGSNYDSLTAIKQPTRVGLIMVQA